VGRSGWLRESECLGYYAKHFDIVELNNTFYRLPTEAAVLRWRDTSSRNFHFAVKGSRSLTHMKKLKVPRLGLERFFLGTGKLMKCAWVFSWKHFHGETAMPSSFAIRAGMSNRSTSYSRNSTPRIASSTQRLRKWDLNEAYVFFDNDQAAYAVEDARRLQSLLDE
jgi:uncharacterized protein YecE (DUF72 family)